jgi:hypothetical protein
VAKLTPLAEEVANLRTRETEAYRHADKVEKMSTYLSDKEATRIKKERDELLQRDA